MRTVLLAALLIFPTVALAADKPVADPAAAIAAADASRNGAQGRFAMTVAAVGRVSRAVFVNSTPDYRQADNVTFVLTPAVERHLAREHGASAETYLPGKRIVVDGLMRRVPIVNVKYGRVKSFNRWAHQLTVRLPSQIVSVE